ncbi:MAG: DinB family protein, partial [Candidatus Doudnabacteria bacterium]|nr:DinB family protein [Candidatus Doudnabacteria bacterium]
AMQWEGISKVIKTDDISMGDYPKQQSKQQMLEMFDKNLDQLLSDVNSISDDQWENGNSSMGDMWKDKKYMMAWGFLFDAIHHRGQLSTYLRAMGSKVPAIYGPSADAQS